MFAELRSFTCSVRYIGDWVQSPVGTTLTIPSTDFDAQIVGVAVSQVVSLASGTLHTPLNGATTTVVVTPTSGTFDTTNAITILGHAIKPIPTAMDLSATTKWGDIGDWDVSGVADFSYAFSGGRNKVGGSYEAGGNPKAATFVGTAMSKWITTSVTSLERTFWKPDMAKINGGGAMNADLSTWDVAKVTTLKETFEEQSAFTGEGLAKWNTAQVTTLHTTFGYTNEFNGNLGSWDVAKVKTMYFAFKGASKFEGTGLFKWNVEKVDTMDSSGVWGNVFEVCSKIKIADAWSNSASSTAKGAALKWASLTSTTCPLTDLTLKKASWGTCSVPHE